MVGEPEIEIRVLGRFCVRCRGEEIPNEAFGGRLPRRLLRVLATELDHVVPRDVLIDALWPRRAPADPDGNLNVLVNRARRALGRTDAIQTATGGYRLAAERCRLDVQEFRRLRAEGCAAVDRGEPAIGMARLLAALELWGEPLPEDMYEEWAQPVRRELSDLHQSAIETAAAAALLVHQPQQAASLARQALDHDPLREQVHLLLVRALAASGERAGALAALGRLRRVLDAELGIEVCDEAIELERQLLGGTSASPPGARSSARHDRPERFVGRQHELEVLCGLAPGSRRVAVVRGEAGSGKSSLLAETVRRTRLPAILTRAFLPESATPWALARTLLDEVLDHDISAVGQLPDASSRALAELVLPELSTNAASAVHLEEETRRALAMEGAIRLLESAASEGALLVVDDLQWADATSLELLALAAARIADLVIVVAHRPLVDDGHVSSFLTDLHRLEPVVSIDVGRLQVGEIAELTGDPELAQVLADESDGTPFAVCEALAQLRTNGAFDVAPAVQRTPEQRRSLHDAARLAAREGKRRSILARVAQESPDCRQLLSLMALLGREASAALLALASDRGQRDVVNDLDRLARAGLARLGDRGWAPAHDIIAQSILENLPRTDRGRLHLFLADALEHVVCEPGERALHLLGAGDEGAAAAFAHAARMQLDRHAHQEAGRLADLGFEAVADAPTRRQLLAIRADTRAHQGDLRGARADLREALAGTEPGPLRSSLLARSARLAMSAGDVHQAGHLVDLALLEAADDARARAEALALGAIVDMNTRTDERAETRAAEALAHYEQLGDAGGAADILDARAMATFLNGDIRGGIKAFEHVAQLFDSSGNLLRVVTPRSTRGHGLVFLGEPAQGLAETERALEVARTLGHRESQAYALWHRSEAQSALGRTGEALESAHEALRLAEQVGHRGWTATGWRAIGLALACSGEHEAALEAFGESLAVGEAVPLFCCWAHARMSLACVELGDLEAAAEHARLAVAVGPPLGQYEARLARAVVATLRDEETADQLVATAHRRAVERGHLVSADALLALRRG